MRVCCTTSSTSGFLTDSIVQACLLRDRGTDQPRAQPKRLGPRSKPKTPRLGKMRPELKTTAESLSPSKSRVHMMTDLHTSCTRKARSQIKTSQNTISVASHVRSSSTWVVAFRSKSNKRMKNSETAAARLLGRPHLKRATFPISCGRMVSKQRRIASMMATALSLTQAALSKKKAFTLWVCQHSD